MRIQELGHEIRQARLARGWTQAQLASAAGLSRVTLNLLESGLVRDLGVRKVLAVLEKVGLGLTVRRDGRPRRPDYVRMACTSASVSYRNELTEGELIHALKTGKVPAGREAHLQTLFDEAPAALLRGLAKQASEWSRPGRLEKSLHKLADTVGALRRIDQWLKTG